jgi:type II secretory pathway pseudopilin PulG
MLKKKGTRGTTLIALLVVVAVLALAASGAAYVGFDFTPDASWAEGV